MDNFRVGDILYHKTNRTKCKVKGLLDRNVVIELEHLINGKQILVLPKSHIGEYLFYKEEHIDLLVCELSMMNEYSEGDKIIAYKQEKLLKGDELQRKEITKILEKRKIKRLVHFTRIENLESILKNGFISRSILKERNLKFILNDPRRKDERVDCVCFTIEFPNFYLLNKFKRDCIDSRWCIIEVDAEVIINHYGKVYFCYQNASSSEIWFKKVCEDYSFENNLSEFSTPEAFKKMFQEKDYHKNRSAVKNIRDYLPTSPQAEILLSHIITTDYIKRVNFKDMQDCEYFLSILSDKKCCDKFEFYENKELFTCRDDLYFPDRN